MTTRHHIVLKDFSALSFDVFMGTAPASSPINPQPRQAPVSARDSNVPPGGSAEAQSAANDVRECDKALSYSGDRARRAARLLVADDSPGIRSSLEKVLRAEGYEVELAADGDEVLRKFDRAPIDLVLLDLDMPVTDGWSAFEELLTRNPRQAIVIISGKHGPRDWARAGAPGLLVEKPIDVPGLLKTIREALDEPPEQRECRVLGQRMLSRHTRPVPFLRWQCYARGGLNK
jgi:CheY-like chemotaxis protein